MNCAILRGSKVIRYFFTFETNRLIVMYLFKKILQVLLSCSALFFVHSSLAVTYVCFETSLGTFCMEMHEASAPGTTTNFLTYVRDGHYNNTFIHRTVPNFIIQGGGYKLEPLGQEISKGPQITNEFNRPNVRGTVAMAKFADQPNSASNEWFVNLADNSASLDTTNGGYTVFATIVSGMSVVDSIGNLGRVNLSSSLGNAFTEIPVVSKDDNGVGVEDLVQIKRAYISDTIVIDANNPTAEATIAEKAYACTTDWVAQIAPKQVCMDTPSGTFCIELSADSAPLTVANFLHYVADGDYTNSFFHRSVKDFVVQAGAMTLNPLFAGVPIDAPVKNEFKISNTRGTVAMAKADGAPDSATNQWFVNTKDNSTLLDTNNGGFTVFGNINADGMAVIDKIAALTVYDFSSMNPTLGELPLYRSGNFTGLTTTDFVKITKAYIPGVGTNPCIPTKPAALTELANQRFELPVRIGNKLYSIIFTRELNNPNYVFNADLIRIRTLTDTGQMAAVYTPENGVMIIPSMLIDAKNVITNVRMKLTNKATLQFSLESYSPL